MADATLLRPLRLAASALGKPWGGTRLPGGAPGIPIGELWLAGPSSRLSRPSTRLDGTLDELALRFGPSLVGQAGMSKYGPRFPLLVKLIDAAGWLSLQVHPDDRQARSLSGAAAVGKHEAWYVIAAGRDGTLIVGPHPAADKERLAQAVRAGLVERDLLEAVPADEDMIIDIAPGTMHSIGPGVLLYEVQQPSDLTYRISDWGRTATPDRPLHFDEVRACLDLSARGVVSRRAQRNEAMTLTTEAFQLVVMGRDATLEPHGHSPHVLTVVRGSALVEGDDWVETLEPWSTLVIPAEVPRYQLRPAARSRVCVASLP
jgi:mannose-6-phosphate isomerase